MECIKKSNDLAMICMSMFAVAALTASAFAGSGPHPDGSKGCDHPGDCPMMNGANAKKNASPNVLSFNSQDGNHWQPKDQTNFQIITKSQDEDGNGHSVILKRVDENGKETIYLNIDGKKYTVGSMDEANEIIKKHGMGGMVQMEFPALPNFHQQGNQNPHQQQDQQRAIEHPHAMLGVALAPVNPAVRSYLGINERVGVMVANVVPDTPADEAGLLENDLITGVVVNGQAHKVNEQSFRKIIGQQKPGNEVDLQILRAGQAKTVEVKLAKWDGDKLGVQFGQQDVVIEGLHPGQFNNMPNGMADQMLRQMMPNMPENMNGMHEFRMQLDPEKGTWERLGEKGEQDQDNNNGRCNMGRGNMDHGNMGRGNMDHGNMGHGDKQFQGEPDMKRMMQMMEQRMRRFQEQMKRMLKQQNKMQQQMKNQEQSKDGIDT